MPGQKVELRAETAGKRLYKVTTTLEVCLLAPEDVDATSHSKVLYRAGAAIRDEISVNEAESETKLAITEITKAEDIPSHWAGAIPWTPDNTLAQPIEVLLGWINAAKVGP